MPRTPWAAGGSRVPGRAVFDAASAELGPLPVLAEDLGDIDEPVHELRRSLGYPGMAVLQFGFEPSDPHNTHDPAQQQENQVVYTGTHDNDTVVRVVGHAAGRAPRPRAGGVARGRCGRRR